MRSPEDPGVEVYGDFSLTARTGVVSLNVAGYSSKEAGDLLAQE